MPLSAPVPLDQLTAVGSSISIEELEPTTPGGRPRKLILVGPALPLQGGIDWAGDTKLVTTWYPGNGVEASQQVLGAVEMPSQWSGEWRRAMMGRAPTTYYDETGTRRGIIDPMDLWSVLDDFRISAARLRVTWSIRGRELVGTREVGSDRPVDFQVVREGRLKMLKVQPLTETEIPWSA
jgi:hypothetical protein